MDLSSKRTISLSNGREIFVLKYESGQECNVLDHAIDLARGKDNSFDVFDLLAVTRALRTGSMELREGKLPHLPHEE